MTNILWVAVLTLMFAIAAANLKDAAGWPALFVAVYAYGALFTWTFVHAVRRKINVWRACAAWPVFVVVLAVVMRREQ